MRWAWLFLAACAIGALVSFWPRSPVAPFTGTLPVLATAPTWTLHDVDGRDVRAEDFKGKVVIVDFWATWCEPCRKEIPNYIALQKKYAAQGLVVLGISVDTIGAAAVKRFGEAQMINYPLLMADDVTVKAFGGIEGIPSTFLMDRAGRVRHQKIGVVDASWYESLVATVLKESTPGVVMPALPQPLPAAR